MNGLTINISWEYFLGIMGALIVGAWYLSDRFATIKTTLNSISEKLETLWKDRFAPSNSPRQLNDIGNGILEKSGIKNIVDEKKTKLLELVRGKGATNAYDAEKAIEEVMSNLPTHCPDITNKLKDGAFKTGADINALLFVGSIYLRNQIFNDLGFSLTDLDKPKNS